jgi:RNA 2',3'-cyclic 3'-phosphodiesterase
MSESIRAFLAFDIENTTILERLNAAQQLLVQTGADLKQVQAQNIHITIRFLGEISPSMVNKVFKAMQEVNFKPFTIKFCGLGVFPSLSYPRVVWIGITDGAQELKSIFDQIEPQMRNLGFAADSQPFSPHLTIARVKSSRNKAQLVELVAKRENYDFGAIKAECFKLKRSHLSPRGPTYSTLKEVCPQQ